MDDFSKDIIEDKAVSAKMRRMLDKEKSEARKRIVERGIVHFRADEQFMEALLRAAEEQKIAPGTLCRNVVWKYLNLLGGHQPISNSAEPYKLTVNEASTSVYGLGTTNQADPCRDQSAINVSSIPTADGLSRPAIFPIELANDLAKLMADVSEIKQLLTPTSTTQKQPKSRK